ncbi:uncharacterized protein NEMAJ01_2120 [Nematocida major]|uniref:uncharacterized protein n=1 Tax=Nematocida major TaxID=1912982 RepID=UPI002007EDAF|nr:uncharacterized protein NEMAJ01_2120 [Nematocida major]KAH9387224.1 hypothetical protein NEMAJ01_2120 [Nematocida major]
MKGQIVKTVLPNGISVILRKLPVEEYLVGVCLKGGSIKNAEAGHPEGTAHFLEHVLVQQTDPSIKKAHNVSGRTTQTHISVYGNGKGDGAAALAKSLLSAAGKPVEAESLRKELPRILEEMQRVRKSGQEKEEKLVGGMFPNSPLNASILGHADTLEKITPCTIQSFLESTFASGNALLVGVGNINVSEMIKAAAEIPCRPAPNRSAAPFSAASSLQSTPKSAHTESTEKQPSGKEEEKGIHVFVGYRIPYTKDIKDYAMYLAIANSIQKQIHSMGLDISVRLHYTELGGVLYFLAAKEAYSTEKLEQIMNKAADQVAEDTRKIVAVDPENLALSMLELPGYLFSIGLGLNTEKDLLDTLRTLKESELKKGIESLHSENTLTFTAKANRALDA